MSANADIHCQVGQIL